MCQLEDIEIPYAFHLDSLLKNEHVFLPRSLEFPKRRNESYNHEKRGVCNGANSKMVAIAESILRLCRGSRHGYRPSREKPRSGNKKLSAEGQENCNRQGVPCHDHGDASQFHEPSPALGRVQPETEGAIRQGHQEPS
jgi:hypothetical protein